MQVLISQTIYVLYVNIIIAVCYTNCSSNIYSLVGMRYENSK